MPDTPTPSPGGDFAASLSDRYDDLKPLGGGGMAELLVGRERRLDRQVVIKRVARSLASEDARDRFHQEIALLATLQHPNIVPLLHADELDGTPYFVMPLVQGESLRDRLLRGPLSVRETLAILEDVAMALEAAHARGVVHRDIKPANILLTGSAAVVADFGIAKALARTPAGRAVPLRTPTDLTLEGMSLGTPRYMAPEQFTADPDTDHRADIYAWGVVAYEMLAGAPPFDGANAAQLARAHLAEAPAALSARRADVPPALERLVLRCLEKDPAARPATATELLRALRASEIRSADAAPTKRKPEGGRSGALTGLGQDLKHAARALARTPSLLVACLVCLALGLGATAAAYSVVDRAILRDLPFDEPEQLVTLWRHVNSGTAQDPHAPRNFLDLQQEPAFEGLAALANVIRLVELGDYTEPASTYRVSGTLFPLLRTRAQHGRLITPADDSAGAPEVVVLSHEFWQQHLGGSPGVIGTTLRVDGIPHVVAGVLPPDFSIPDGRRVLSAALWIPMRFTDDEARRRTSNYLRVVGRVAPGVSIAQAEAATTARFNGIVEENPRLIGTRVVVRSMQHEAGLAVRAPLLLLLTAALAVLAIAVINVSSLLLARGIRRQPELALRNALGGSRWDVMRPVLAESLIVAVGGWAIGLGAAMLAVRSIGSMAAQRMPQLAGATVDWRVAAVMFVVALLAAALGAVAPAHRALRVQPADAMRGGRAAGSCGQHRTLALLVTAEGALALALLIAAGLVLAAFVRLAQSDPGFDPARVLSMRLRVSPSDYTDGLPAPAFLTPALERVRALPGVEAAGAISQLPYSEWGWNSSIQYEDKPELPPTQRPQVETRNIEPGFFAVTGQTLLRGRLLDERDFVRVDSQAPRVVVNAALVARDFPDRDPIGRRFRIGDQPMEIVGVVSDIRNWGPYQDPRPEAYWTYHQRHPSAPDFWLVVRSSGENPVALAGSVQAALREVNARVAISDIRPMPEVISASLGQPRLLFALFGTLALIALVLALAGLFGILSYTVEQQRAEFGVRAALGAPPSRLVGLVISRAAVIVAFSVAVGLGLAWAISRVMGSLLFGIEPEDPLVWGVAVAAMLVAGLLASLAPAARAARVQPALAMRAD